jgi:hypothetical protein
MPTDIPSTLTLAILLTAAGALAGATLVTGLVQLLKTIWPGDVPGVWQLRAAFALAAVLVILAYVSGVQTGAITVSPESLFGAVLAWYATARLAKSIYDDATAAPGSLRAAQ